MTGHSTPIGADEPIDRVAGRPDVMAWKRAARPHQNIESLLGAADGLLPDVPEFRARYLDFEVTP